MNDASSPDDMAAADLDPHHAAIPAFSDEPAEMPEWTGDLETDVINAIRTVFDPEIPVNVYDLGLIYRVDIANPEMIDIDMTLTAPGCPVAGEMLRRVEKAVVLAPGAGGAKVHLVFDPPWDPNKMSDEAKLELGML
jgi:FeS assembly SUF system protein